MYYNNVIGTMLSNNWPTDDHTLPDECGILYKVHLNTPKHDIAKQTVILTVLVVTQCYMLQAILSVTHLHMCNLSDHIYTDLHLAAVYVLKVSSVKTTF